MAAGRSNRLTTRDYKRPVRRSLDMSRLREFGGGLLVGLVLASGVFIYKSDAKKAPLPETPRPEPQRAAKAEADDATAGESGDRYDFYEMLPNFEVVVPEKDKEVTRERDNTPATITRPGMYVLQAGSYRKQEEADRIRAQLERQGITAAVQRVAVDDDVWHRVRIGPINDLTELNRLRSRLRAADLDALVIRVGE